MRKPIVLFIATLVAAMLAMPAVAVAFNPQPEPPARPGIWAPPGWDVMFNPQPEPPAYTPIGQLNGGVETHAPGLVRDAWLPPGSIYMFNPQPEPPAYTPIMQVNAPS